MADASSGTQNSTLFTTEDVMDLGKALMEIGDRYPTRFFSERDFFPLVAAYLHGRVPSLKAEAIVEGGDIDFRLGGANPSVLELAVAPRALQDPNAPNVEFPGHKNATQLYATQNRSELKKLGLVPQSQARMRYLLLLDFQRNMDVADLRSKYEKAADEVGIENPVAVVYVHREATETFTLRRR